MYCYVVPFQIYSGKLFASPVSSYFIMLPQYFEEVLGVMFSDIFNAGVVNNQEILDWSPLVPPKSLGCGGFIVIVLV